MSQDFQQHIPASSLCPIDVYPPFNILDLSFGCFGYWVMSVARLVFIAQAIL
jgi:hypothetical protein